VRWLFCGLSFAREQVFRDVFSTLLQGFGHQARDDFSFQWLFHGMSVMIP